MNSIKDDKDLKNNSNENPRLKANEVIKELIEKYPVIGDMFITTTDGYFELKIKIKNRWKQSDSGKTIKISDPYNSDIIGLVQDCNRDEIDAIIEELALNRKCWEDTKLSERANILRKAANLMDEMAPILGKNLSLEIGKPLGSAISEIKRTATIFRLTADAGSQMTYGELIRADTDSVSHETKYSLANRVPLGVVLCIGPFNYPFNLTGSKIAPALMGGNSVLMKSSTQGSITSSFFIPIMKMAGLPDGVFSMITGRGSTIGDYIVSHKKINMIAFTGSTPTGLNIASKAAMKPLLMELGGKDAAIILEDADLELTLKAIISGAFSYSGQRCTAVKRLLPMPKITNNLINLLVEKIKTLDIGDPLEDKTIGPLISSKQCNYVQSLIDDAIEKGATILIGNKRDGNIIYPTLIDNVTKDMRIAWEEPFGPVLPIIRVSSVEEAINISNKSEYGLQGMIFSKNIDLAFNIAQELDVGTVQINGKSSRGPDHFPFMGSKSSGIGTQGIRYALDAMTRQKSIVLNLSEKGSLINSCKK